MVHFATKFKLLIDRFSPFFRRVVDSYALSTYLDVTRKNPNRKTLVKLRISNHELNIETRRYDKISRCDRICPVCGLSVEYYIHFLFDYPKYSSVRDDFLNKIENRIPNYKHIPIPTSELCGLLS